MVNQTVSVRHAELKPTDPIQQACGDLALIIALLGKCCPLQSKTVSECELGPSEVFVA